MKTSVMIKKILMIIGLGLAFLLAVNSFLFFCYMGNEFGYRDLQKSSYLESCAFADSVWAQMYRFGVDAETMNSFIFSDLDVTLNYMEYDKDSLQLVLDYQDEMTYTQWMEEGNYDCVYDDEGITEVYIAEDEDYEADWYGCSLSYNDIMEHDAYTVVSKEDYIRLMLAYATPNEIQNLVVSDAAEEETYINDSFSPDSYILSVDDLFLVYSPDEDIFYSSVYGWYTIPNELYFTTYTYGDSGTVDLSDSIDVMLLTLPFTDKNTILLNKVDAWYPDYLVAKLNMEDSERNLVYFVVSDSKIYHNIDLTDIKRFNQYMVIYKSESGDYTAVLNGFENAYLTDSYITSLMLNIPALQPDQDLYIGINNTYPYYDNFYYEQDMFERYYKFTIPALILGILMTGVVILLLIILTKRAGRASKEDSTIYLNFIDKCPEEILLVAGVLSLIYMINDTYNDVYYTLIEYSYWSPESYIATVVLCFTIFITVYLSFVRRIKAHQMWHRSLIRTILRLFRRFVRAVVGQKNLALRAFEMFLVYWLIMVIGGLFLIEGKWEAVRLWLWVGVFLVLGVNALTLVLLIRQAKGEQLISRVTEILAEGDLDAEVPQGKSLTTERRILENINHLKDGLRKAVEQSIYDERMKAELITNVSHDIKTPLTSIINYVDLIKRENIENEKVLHYIEVLDWKSHRLKQLTEDLVEISKITSGNIELECMPIDFGELVRQSIGEFEDKFAEHGLHIVDNISAEPLMIYADGRRTFRVLDNLMQNIYKYAMPKTRVYIDLLQQENQIRLSIKNISKAELNIDAKELMERFVRGEQSRSTEGSGLGLSIAGDLVRIQNGNFDLVLDGDLFKVIITFPQYYKEIPASIDCDDEARSDENQE